MQKYIGVRECGNKGMNVEIIVVPVLKQKRMNKYDPSLFTSAPGSGFWYVVRTIGYWIITIRSENIPCKLRIQGVYNETS
jgi:hypothetical protein